MGPPTVSLERGNCGSGGAQRVTAVGPWPGVWSPDEHFKGPEVLPNLTAHFSLPDNRYWGSVTTSQSNVVSPTLAPLSPTDPMPQAPALWIETTAYGLLHLLLREGKAELADQVANWLMHQASFHGGFRSTQVGLGGVGRGWS